MTEILLLPFNGQLNLRNAYDWDRNQIYNFLQDVVNNPANYGVLWSRETDLADIREHLLRLSLPNGPDFRAVLNLRPDQHIYRAANGAWIPRRPDRPRRGRPPLPPQPPATISKFMVRQYLHSGRGYWSPYDLLGLFLSLIGPAPDGATKRNFYLPMTAVYGRWCSQIAGWDCADGVGDLPYMFQCTWRTGPPTWFCLGSSLAGYEWAPNWTGTWERVLRYARFALIDPVPLIQLGYNFNNSPLIRLYGSGSTRFGNCAETYPFVDLLEGHNHNEETCHGLALQREYVYTDGYQDMRSGVIWGSLCDPCRNCSALIAWYGGNINNFRAGTESAGAPP